MEKTEGKRQRGRRRHRWDYNIKTDLKELFLEDMGRTDLSHERDKWRAIVNAVMKLRVP
jgi:hypothetical protein